MLTSDNLFTTDPTDFTDKTTDIIAETIRAFPVFSEIPIAIGTVESVVNQLVQINILNINVKKSAIYLSGP